MSDPNISVELIYAIDAITRPAMRYADGRITSAGEVLQQAFPYEAYRDAVAKDIRDVFVRAVLTVGRPQPTPVQATPPVLYAAEQMRGAGGEERLEVEVGNLTYRVEATGATVTVEQYTAFDLSWGEWLWALTRIEGYLAHLEARQ